MAKRRQWKDELKPQRDTCEDDEKKKRKIEIISDITYKHGKTIQSERYIGEDAGTSSKYYFPEPSSFPTTPRHLKSAVVGDVKDLTPTFRKPKYYMSETKRIIDNIPSTHFVPHNDDNLIQDAERTIINDDISENDLENIARIVQPILTTSTIAEIETTENLQNRYEVLVTCESDHSLESPETSQNFTEKSNHSDEPHQISKYNRKCKKKLHFDKIYLDFIEEEDADTLLLNEAFPSEDSSVSFSEDETSDDSISNKKGIKKSKKQTKKSKRRIAKNTEKKNNSNKSETKEKNTEQEVLKTRPKKKLCIKNDNKMKRILGQSYTNEKGEDVPSKTMKPNPCKDVICKRNCGEITEERRQRLFTYYWNLGSSQRQKDWISQCAIKKDVKCYTTDKGESSRRNYSYAYYINEDDGRRQVCQKFLINTLDITQRLLLYTLNNAVEGFAKLDDRKKNGGGNKTKEEVISHAKQFLTSLPLVPSHYCRKDSTRLYLPDDLKNISNLYRIYTKDCADNGVNKMSFKVFSNWLKTNYNIGFHVPKKDKCMTCMIQTYDVKNEEELSNFEDHLREKNESYKRFQCHQKLNAIDPSVICASFDMQKVLNTPHGENMALYYSRKIAVYNMTVYESNTQAGYCNLWTEVDAHRGANEISTCVFKYLQEVDERQKVKTVLLYSDSCYGQNKNKTMLSMFRYFLSKSKNIDVIQMNYLIPGHTFMPVDSMHATIERAVKKTTIWAPSQWPIVVEMARRNPAPYRVSVLEGQDFMGFEDILNSTFKKNQKLQISKLCIATFKKSNSDKMFIKYSMLPDAEATEVKLCSLNGSEPKCCLYSAKLPVSLQKYNDLKKLVDKNIIPRTYAKEYLCLKRDKKVQDVLNDTDEEDTNQ